MPVSEGVRYYFFVGVGVIVCAGLGFNLGATHSANFQSEILLEYQESNRRLQEVVSTCTGKTANKHASSDFISEKIHEQETLHGDAVALRIKKRSNADACETQQEAERHNSQVDKEDLEHDVAKASEEISNLNASLSLATVNVSSIRSTLKLKIRALRLEQKLLLRLKKEEAKEAADQKREDDVITEMASTLATLPGIGEHIGVIQRNKTAKRDKTEVLVGALHNNIAAEDSDTDGKKKPFVPVNDGIDDDE